MKAVFKFIGFIAVGVSILYFVYVNQAAGYEAECACKGGCEFNNLLDKITNDFKGANFFWLLMICLAFMLSNISRALRWNQLIEPLGYKPKTFNSFFATMVGYMINLALPRAGEIAKPAMLTKYEKIPIEKLVGTIVIDRVFDVMMLLIITGITFLTQFNYLYDFLFGVDKPSAECIEAIDNSSSFPWIGVFKALILLGIIFSFLLFIKWKTIKKTPIAQKIIALILSFFAGMKTVFKLKNPFMFFVHTVLIWTMYYLMMYICFFAYAPTSGLSPMAALLAFTFGTFGMVIPSPGGMGTYQIAVTAALVVYGVAEADAFAFSNIIFFTITLFCNIAFGLLAYILLPLYNKGYEPKLPETHG
ncbi:MAG: flippase-like domain-containing protein [Saprospiraceae bacterium]|nr:flippase-like domain-containing protein [Saprospiraceae bacterium]